jgi:hypothetical protein
MKKLNRDKLDFYIKAKLNLLIFDFKLPTGKPDMKKVMDKIHPHELDSSIKKIKKEISDQDLIPFIEFFVSQIYNNWILIDYGDRGQLSLISIYNSCHSEYFK